MEPMTIFYIIVGILLICVLIYWFASQSHGNHRIEKIEEDVSVGMTIAELIEKFGEPNKTVEIGNGIKLYTYSFDKWKGAMFGGTEHREITLTITDGNVTSISR